MPQIIETLGRANPAEYETRMVEFVTAAKEGDVEKMLALTSPITRKEAGDEALRQLYKDDSVPLFKTFSRMSDGGDARYVKEGETEGWIFEKTFASGDGKSVPLAIVVLKEKGALYVASVRAAGPLQAPATEEKTSPPVDPDGPVKRIDVYVTPFYQAARTKDGPPAVAVGARFDKGLSSNDREDILAVRDAIVAEPDLVTPMTMMVLAVRLYDVGLRDESVFWFYVAKYRYATLSEVLERTPQLAQSAQAVRAFSTLAGPIINGYAFCDIQKQKQTHTRAIDWVEKNPYKAIFLPELTAKPGDRAQNLKAVIERMRQLDKDEAAKLEDPEFLADMARSRKEHKMQEKFCWR
jgi:hypothetical protein